MPSVYDLKPRFQALLRPTLAPLARLGFTPNIVTGLAVAGSIAVGAGLAFAAAHPAFLLLLPLWLFVRMGLNAVDGMMARELRMQSSLGAVLNEVGDVVSDVALYLPLAWVSPSSLWPVVAFTLGAAFTEFCGVLAQALGASRRYDGPMGKSDRAFWIGALALGSWAFPELVRAWPLIFSLAAALTLLTCWNRVAKALAEMVPRS